MRIWHTRRAPVDSHTSAGVEGTFTRCTAVLYGNQVGKFVCTRQQIQETSGEMPLEGQDSLDGA